MRPALFANRFHESDWFLPARSLPVVFATKREALVAEQQRSDLFWLFSERDLCENPARLRLLLGGCRGQGDSEPDDGRSAAAREQLQPARQPGMQGGSRLAVTRAVPCVPWSHC